MQESAVPNKKGTLSDKSKTSRKRTRTISSSTTSPLESTSREKVCRPFWNTCSREWSQKLWLPTETGLHDLDATCWSSSSQKLALNSWFSVKMRKTSTISAATCSPSPPSLSHPITDAVLRKIESDERRKLEAKQRRDEKKVKMTDQKEEKKKKKSYEKPLRARKVRIFPTQEQKTGIKQWFGAVRFCYNALVFSQRNVGQGGINLASLRKTIKDTEELNVWLKEIPGEIKDVAVRDYDKARAAHFAKLKKKKQSDPSARNDATFKFRSKKDYQQSFEVRPRDMARKSGKFAFINLETIKAAEELPLVPECAVRFVYDKLGRYFLIVPRGVDFGSENQASTVSLDPGVRTFQTTYDTEGLSCEWGKNDMEKVFLTCRRIDKCQSAWTKKKGSKRKATKKAWLRMMNKVKNKIKEVHCKLAVWLCENYKVILIPRFECSKMVRRADRKINTKTARNMLTWSHYAFRELLKNKAELYLGVKVVECDEPYTSKTCGCCGEINTKLGGAKRFTCKKCSFVADRDINGARNILLRYLTLFCESG